MRQQHRESQTADGTKVTLNPLFQRLFGIGIALLIPMAVDCPWTTAGTDRTQSFELIFSKLDRRPSSKRPRPIKPLSSGLSVSPATDLPLTVQPHARSLIRSATAKTMANKPGAVNGGMTPAISIRAVL